MSRLALLVALLAVIAMATPATAGPKSRAERTSTTRTTRTPHKAKAKKAKKKPRADLGELRSDRVPARAKVATGETRPTTKASRRKDTGNLTLSEKTAQDIEEVLRGPLRAGTTSLYVADATTGETVFSVYPDDPLNPASNVKLIATATALDILGPDYRYLTRILGEGPDAWGVVNNDLYLLGSYDATLTRANLDEMVQQLVAAGVTQLDGDVVVGGTPTRDGMYRSFVDFAIAPGAPGQPPTVTMVPQTDFVKIVVTATTSPKKRVKKGLTFSYKYVTDEFGDTRIEATFGGQIAFDAKPAARDIWIKERALHTAHLFIQLLRDAGVSVNGGVHVTELRDYMDASLESGFIPVPLAEHRSQRLAEIVQRVNKRSTNWLANRVLVTAAARKYGGKPDMKNGIEAMYAWLEKHTGLTRDDVVVDSGSGLSYKTELSARQMVTVLRAALGLDKEPPTERDADIQDAYRQSLAIGGIDGTIRRRFKSVSGTVRGKTGTLKRVVSLSGVIEVAPDRQLVFSIITNGHDPSWKTRIRGGHERVVALLCRYLHGLPTPEAPVPEIAVTITADDGTPATSAEADESLLEADPAEEDDEPELESDDLDSASAQ